MITVILYGQYSFNMEQRRVDLFVDDELPHSLLEVLSKLSSIQPMFKRYFGNDGELAFDNALFIRNGNTIKGLEELIPSGEIMECLPMATGG